MVLLDSIVQAAVFFAYVSCSFVIVSLDFSSCLIILVSEVTVTSLSFGDLSVGPAVGVLRVMTLPLTALTSPAIKLVSGIGGTTLVTPGPC